MGMHYDKYEEREESGTVNGVANRRQACHRSNLHIIHGSSSAPLALFAGLGLLRAKLGSLYIKKHTPCSLHHQNYFR